MWRGAFLLALAVAVPALPVVLMHGIFADAPDMDEVEAWIKRDRPGTHVLSVSVGSRFWTGPAAKRSAPSQEMAETKSLPPGRWT